MMKPMSFSETIFLFFLALIIFGPKKLPEIARTVGKALNEFRRASNEFKAQIEQEISHLDVEKQTILPPNPPMQGTTSRTLNAVLGEPGAAGEAPAAEVPTTGAQATLATTPETAATGSSTEQTPRATEAVHPADAVTSTSSQESHA